MSRGSPVAITKFVANLKNQNNVRIFRFKKVYWCSEKCTELMDDFYHFIGRSIAQFLLQSNIFWSINTTEQINI